ncbi:MAG: serine hydrolase [Saprospiraceae bacterium]|nr:serine hydrolase [Saprospiraceae bacterium]
MKNLFLILSLFTTSVFVSAQSSSDTFLADLMKQQPDKFANILANAADLRVQILYTKIDRDKKNRPKFTSYRFRVNADEYFYPASTIKLPASLLALEKLNQLHIKGLTRTTPMLSDSVYEGQIKQFQDPTNLENSGLPTVEHYIKKILLVSDNDAHNRLYEFMGQEAFNEMLKAKGFKNIRVTHRLQTSMTREQNKRSNPVCFSNNQSTEGKISTNCLYTQPMLVSTKDYKSPKPIGVGKGFMRRDSLINEPFDFTYRNNYPIETQQQILKTVLFPETVPRTQRFDLTEDDYAFVRKYMSMSPLESKSPKYPDADSAGTYDSYCKFLMFGDDKKPMPKTIRIFNKVGDAYGFLIDNAYIVDFEKGIEFMLTVTIYCNADGVFNDDKYDYDKVGYPFMANIGKAIYNYELGRKRKRKADLGRFKFVY